MGKRCHDRWFFKTQSCTCVISLTLLRVGNPHKYFLYKQTYHLEARHTDHTLNYKVNKYPLFQPGVYACEDTDAEKQD
jgi:hypothetical protein